MRRLRKILKSISLLFSIKIEYKLQSLAIKKLHKDEIEINIFITTEIKYLNLIIYDKKTRIIIKSGIFFKNQRVLKKLIVKIEKMMFQLNLRGKGFFNAQKSPLFLSKF